MQENLVNEFYYVFYPNYVGIRGRLDTDEHGTESFRPDDRDGFPGWLKRQTIDDLLFGSNGVYCKITHGEVEKRRGRVISSERTSSECLITKSEAIYNRIIYIRSMPAEKDLPLELTDALKEMGYSLVDPDENIWVKKFREGGRFLG